MLEEKLQDQAKYSGTHKNNCKLSIVNSTAEIDCLITVILQLKFTIVMFTLKEGLDNKCNQLT